MRTIISADFDCLWCDFTAPNLIGMVIACAPTEIFFTVQAGGAKCLHPKIEGYRLPIFAANPDDVKAYIQKYKDFDDCSWGCLHCNKNYETCGCYMCTIIKEQKISKEDQIDAKMEYAEAIDKFLIDAINDKFNVDKLNFKFDYSRILELMEGWWPILFSFPKNDFFYSEKEQEKIKDFKQEFKGYMYLGNCD